MSAPNSPGVFERLLDVLLTSGGGVIVMYEGYFDESGDFETDEKIFCIAGYVLNSDGARQMDAEWRAVLKKYNVPYFHMVDCAHGNGVFADIDKDQRDLMARELISLIKAFTLKGFAFVGHGDFFIPPNPGEDMYTNFATMIASLLRRTLDFARDISDLAYFFESGHSSKGRAYQLLAKQVSKTDSVSFADKEKIALLQAADLLAWQTHKRTVDMHYRKRPARKDFLSLMEHAHDLWFLDRRNDKPYFVLDAWPASRKRDELESAVFDNRGPVSIYREEGDDTPVISVFEANGWRRGMFSHVLARFKDTNGQPFALAMGRTKLYETIQNLVSATSLYAGASVLIRPKDISIENDASIGVVLRVELTAGTFLTFPLTPELQEALKVSLSGAPLRERSF